MINLTFERGFVMKTLYWFEDAAGIPADVEMDLEASLASVNLLRLVLSDAQNNGFQDYSAYAFDLFLDSIAQSLHGLLLGFHYVNVRSDDFSSLVLSD